MTQHTTPELDYCDQCERETYSLLVIPRPTNGVDGERRICRYCAEELISDLAEALQDMVDMFERHIDGREGPDDAADRWDRARAAIAKAI